MKTEIKLTEKQKKFCDYYIETGNGAESARRAGYKGKNHDNMATENLRKPALKSYIEKRMSEKDKERIASQDEILEFYTRIMRGEETEEIVCPDGVGGVFRQNKKLDPKVSLAAAKELAKRYGLDKAISQEGNIDLSVNIITQEDDEDE